MIPKAIEDKPRMTKELRKQLQAKYRHGEAFCHMMYVSDDGREIEWLWNSRDGVTPFIISSRNGKSMRHSYWGEDRFDPDYKPQPGDRIFVDCKPEMVREKAVEYVNRYWDNAEYPMKKVFADPRTREDAVQHFVTEWTKPGSPYVLVVSETAPPSSESTTPEGKCSDSQ